MQDLKYDIFSSNTSKDWPVCVQKMIELKQFIDDVLRVELENMEESDLSYVTWNQLLK